MERHYSATLFGPSMGVALLLISAFALVSPAFAEVAAPSAKDTQQTGATTKDEATYPLSIQRRGDADARFCLEFPTNLQIIACAEKYRPKTAARS